MSTFDPKRTLVMQICRDAASAGTPGTDTRYAALLEGLQQLGWTMGSLHGVGGIADRLPGSSARPAEFARRVASRPHPDKSFLLMIYAPPGEYSQKYGGDRDVCCEISGTGQGATICCCSI